MFSHNFNKILLSAVSFSILTSCAVIDKKDTPKESNWFIQLFEKDGQNDANQATIAYSNGEFEKTLTYTTDALKTNPRNQQALLVGALASEKLGRYNRARQYYEDLIVINGNDTSILGSSNGLPQKISEIAKNNLRAITIAQNKLTVEERDGTKHFAISEEASEEIAKNTIVNALRKEPIKAKETTEENLDDIFSPQEKNIVSRFLILRELAEKDFITKDEFLSRRSANIGGLLPLTHKAPGVGIDAPTPSPDLIIERLEVLKEGVETRTITPREFSAERDIIIEALMSPSPRNRIKNKAPSKNILDAADDLRRLEILYDLNLITEREKQTEKKAIEKYLGIDNSPKKVEPVVVQPAPETEPAPASTTEQASAPTAETTQTPKAENQTKLNNEISDTLYPDVSSPF